MKIDLVLTNLELSGSLKYMGALAEGFAELGHNVRFLYSGVGSDFSLVESALGRHPRVRYAGPWTHWASRELLGSPVLRIFAKGTFSPNQSINVLGNLLSAKRFEEITRETGVIVYVNALAYPPARLRQQRKAREVLIFHEAIGASFLPRLMARPLQSYFRAVARRVDLRLGACGPTTFRAP